MKLDALGNFVPLYFSMNLNFLLPLFPGAIVELENSNWVISQNNYTNLYKHWIVVIWIEERKHKFLKIYYNLSLVCLYIILFMT